MPGRHVPGRARGAGKGSGRRARAARGQGERGKFARVEESRPAPDRRDEAPRVPGPLGLPEATPDPGRGACSRRGWALGRRRPGEGAAGPGRVRCRDRMCPAPRCRGVGRRDGGASPQPGSGLRGGDGETFVRRVTLQAAVMSARNCEETPLCGRSRVLCVFPAAVPHLGRPRGSEAAR